MADRTHGLGATVLVLLVGLGVVAASAVVRGDAVRAQQEVATERAAVRLVAAQDALAHSGSRLAALRIAAAATEGTASPGVPTATSELESQYDRTLAELADLRASPVGPEAAHVRDLLRTAGRPPADLQPLLATWFPAVLDNVFDRPPMSDRRVTSREANLRSLLDLTAFAADVTLDVAFAEHDTGVALHDDDLTAVLRGFGVRPSPAEPTIPVEVVPRELPLSADARAELAEATDELTAMIADLDPAAAARVERLLDSEDGRSLQSVHAWFDAVEEGDAAARPATIGDVAAVAVGLGRALQAEVDALHDGELARLAPEVAALDRRATLATGTALLAALATAALLAALLRQRREDDRRLRAAADTDPLTGIANRRALEAVAARHFRATTTTTHAVVVFDLDGFKPVNDRFGHAVGDEVLVRFAASCRDAVRDERDVAARIGGDEFVLVLFDVDADPRRARVVARRVAAQVASSLDDGIRVGDVSLHVTASSGVAVSDASRGFADALGRADLDLYEQKRARPASPDRPALKRARSGPTGH